MAPLLAREGDEGETLRHSPAMADPALPPPLRFASFDGLAIAYRVLGEGRPVLLLHGFLADAALNWFAPGLAQAISGAGFQVIAPDLRGHGDSAAPDETQAYPPDVLARDQEALVAHLGLGDHDLVGYSLGARTAVRLMVRGARPGRAVLGGMGDAGVLSSDRRRAFFQDAIVNGERAADPRAGRYIQAVMAQRGLRPGPMLGVLRSFVATTAEELARIDPPTLIVSGAQDEDNGSPRGWPP